MSYKKIYDSLHRFIHVDELETQLIESQPFQRLNYIHQLGMAFLVYPGGTHKRFEHSLGVMEIATRIYDHITILDPKKCDQKVLDLVPVVGSKEHLYWRRVLRMAALCHDMGHLPFSHSAEQRLLGENGHEMWTQKIIHAPVLQPLWDELNAIIPERNTANDIAKIAIGPQKMLQIDPENAVYTSWERIVTDMITGDFFGADRIDYLLRDAQYTGLAYGHFDYHQLIETLTILPSPDANPEHELELGVDENGIESAEALLLSRYFIHKRLCQYPSVKAYSFHIARFVEDNFKDRIVTDSVEEYLDTNDTEVLAHVHKVVKHTGMSGYEDASVLLKKKRRFKAIPLRNHVSKRTRKELRESCNIPEEDIGWEMDMEKKVILSLAFPVRSRGGEVVFGESLSDLTIPQKPMSWLFVHYDHVDKIFGELKNIAHPAQ